jgi:hypothetical protein
MILGNHFTKHSRTEISSWNTVYHSQLAPGNVFHFSGQPSVKYVLEHLLQQKGQASHENAYRLSGLETTELWELVDEFSQLFCAG